MSDCCGQPAESPRPACPSCGRPGREVGPITLRALLRAEALARLEPGDYHFCSTSGCPIVYFWPGDQLGWEDVLVPVFQKEAEGGRTVCYCFAISEDVIRQEVEAAGLSASAERVKALVRSGRCACDVRNPQGTCCLGNVFAIAKASRAAKPPVPDDELTSAVHPRVAGLVPGD